MCRVSLSESRVDPGRANQCSGPGLHLGASNGECRRKTSSGYGAEPEADPGIQPAIQVRWAPLDLLEPRRSGSDLSLSEADKESRTDVGAGSLRGEAVSVDVRTSAAAAKEHPAPVVSIKDWGW